MQRLFVYGTLSPGKANHHVVSTIAGSWEAATVKGVLVEEGWGAALGSPGLLLRTDGDDVPGYVLHSPDLDEHLSRLDEFEGVEYTRVVGQVRGADSGEVDAFVYVLNRKTSLEGATSSSTRTRKPGPGRSVPPRDRLKPQQGAMHDD